MASKKDFTIEELTKQCEEAKKNFETLNNQLKQAIQEEADRKKAQLALEKQNRKKEIDDAFENCSKLLENYIKDYGSYSLPTITNDFYQSIFGKSWPWWL